jgi:heat shock protein HslJ
MKMNSLRMLIVLSIIFVCPFFGMLQGCKGSATNTDSSMSSGNTNSASPDMPGNLEEKQRVGNQGEGILSASIGPEGLEWQLVEVSGVPVAPQAHERQAHILLDPVQKKYSGFAGCNNFFGGYELDGSSLKFGPVGATRMFCPDLQMSLETEVFKALDKTMEWKISDDVLLLFDDSEVLARFVMEQRDEPVATAEPQIIGPIWQWVQTLYSDDGKAVPVDPKNYTIQFLKDGTLSVKADCNQKGGRYSAENVQLSIEITHSTMAACPAGSLEDDFVRGLSASAIYFFNNNDLYIDLIYGTGTMRFSRHQD